MQCPRTLSPGFQSPSSIVRRTLSPGPESPANTVTNEIMSLNLDNIFQLDTYVVMRACELMCVLRASKYREKTHTINEWSGL